MAAISTTALHIGIGSGVDVSTRFGGAVGTVMRAVAVGPAVSWRWSGTVVATASAASIVVGASTATAAASATAVSSTATVTTIGLIVVDLGLEG